MAKNTTQAEVVVTLNGQAARTELQRMEREIRNYEKAAADAYKAGNKMLGDKMTKQAQTLRKEMTVSKKEMKDFSAVLKTLNSRSINELKSAASQLRKQINQLVPGTQQFIEKSKQLKEVTARIQSLNAAYLQVNTTQNTLRSSISKLTDTFNKYFGVVTTTIAAVTGLSMAFRKSAQDAAAMDDMYAKVMKTTGLTKEEVEQLNEAFKEMDTRTAREQLNQMAYEAGKLGYKGVENIRQFVEAADVINVALGDVLGEGATLEIAKLAQVFAQSTEALDNLDLKGRMMAVGSAINQLGKESTASESYMVDFLGRLGGVATQAGISADQILGYASALDQMKQKVEMSATAFQKMIQQMIKKPEEFVEAARMPLEEFKKLMETDMNEAIKRVLEGFNEMGGFTQLVPLFKDMGLDGARAASVIASLAANLDKVSEAQATANEHIRLGTSMTREYNIMNQSMQARLEKARKEFKDASITLGKSLNPIMLKTTKLTTYLIKALVTYGKEIKAAAIAVAAFTVVVKLNTIAQTAYNAVVKAGNVLMATWKTIVWAVRVAFYKLIGAQEAATIAQAELNAVMNSNVFVLLATAVAALTVAIVNYTKKTKEASEATKKMAEIEDRINGEYAESAAQVQVLSDIIHNNNLKLEDRRVALNKLKEIVPAYHADLTKEGQLINDNTEALTIYLKNLEKVTRAKILQDEYTQATARVLKAEKDQQDAEARRLQALADAHGNDTEMTYFTMQSTAGAYSVSEITPYGQAVRDVTAATNELTEAQEIQAQILQRIQQENGDAFATRHGELTAEEMEIRSLNQEYQKLFHEIRDANRDNPKAAEDRIADLQREQVQKIAEIRAKYKNAISGEEDPGGGGAGAGSGSGESRYKKALDALRQEQQQEENILKQSYINREIDAKAYEEAMREINLKYLEQKVLLARDYGEDESAAMSAWLDAQISAVELAQKEMDRLAKENDARLKEEQAKFEAEQKKLEALMAEGEKVRASLNPSEARAKELQTELDRLDELHQAKILSETEYEEAVKQLRKKYADEDLQMKLSNVQKYTEKANSILSEAANVVSAIRDAELAKAEATYQADLTAAGDNAEKREEIESEYEKKKLEIQKKYADADMAINIAKTIAAGALAAVQAFAQLGPIGGAVAAALIAVITAADVATIVAQRNAIKATSVNSSSSSGASSVSSIETGTRTMTGYSEGGFTDSAASDAKPVGVVHANEWVAPAPLVRKNPVLFRNLENYRLASGFGRRGSMSRGFADGGYTSPTNESAAMATLAVNEIDWQAMRDFNDIMRYCSTHGLFVKYGDILIAKGKYESFKKETSR